MNVSQLLHFAFAGAISLGSLAFAEEEAANETLEQLLGRARQVWVAKVEPGVMKDENDRPLYRMVSIEKVLFDKREGPRDNLRQWYAPLEDLGTDDYCIQVTVETKANHWVSPPRGKLSEDQGKLNKVVLDKPMTLFVCALTSRIIHPSKEAPTLEEALSEGYILHGGRKIPIGKLVAIAQAREP